MSHLYYDFDGMPISQKRWVELFEQSEARIVQQTDFTDGSKVSTVWLGLDHRFLSDGPPLIYETMIFSNHPDHDGRMMRWSTWVEAEAGHWLAVASLEASGSTVVARRGAKPLPD